MKNVVSRCVMSLKREEGYKRKRASHAVASLLRFFRPIRQSSRHLRKSKQEQANSLQMATPKKVDSLGGWIVAKVVDGGKGRKKRDNPLAEPARVPERLTLQI